MNGRLPEISTTTRTRRARGEGERDTGEDRGEQVEHDIPEGQKRSGAERGGRLLRLAVELEQTGCTVQPVLLELDREMEEAAASLGAGPLLTFRHVVFPNLFPAILSGVALAFARALGEFGSVVLISGNLPFKTEVASVFIFGRIESGDPSGAAAVSVVILIISFVVLLGIGALRRWTTRHDRA